MPGVAITPGTPELELCGHDVPGVTARGGGPGALHGRKSFARLTALSLHNE